MIQKIIKWLGSHQTAAQAEIAEVNSLSTRPAWCVVITLNCWDEVKQYKTASTTDLPEALRMANRLVQSVLYAALMPAQFAKHLPLFAPAVDVVGALPKQLSCIDVLHKRQCVN